MKICDLHGQVVLVTGGSRGIGRAIAVACAAVGARVVAAGRDRAALAETMEAVEAVSGDADGSCRELIVDVADEASVREGFASIAQVEGRLDVLVNNAGIGRYAPVADLDLADVDAVMQVNVRGLLACCQEALRLMLPVDRGCIVNIGSVVSLKGYPRQAVYTASKHAVLGITKSLAAEVQGSGLRVSAVLPGGVDTEMVAQARPDLDRSILLRPEDVARSVLFLLGLGEQAAIDTIYVRRRDSAPF